MYLARGSPRGQHGGRIPWRTSQECAATRQAAAQYASCCQLNAHRSILLLKRSAMAAPSKRATAPHEDASEGEDLASIPEKYQLTRRTYLTKAGGETLLK